MRLVAVVFAAAALLPASVAPASAADPVKRCGSGGTTSNGTFATNVRARTVSCAAARTVARRARLGAEGTTASTKIDGRTWRCRVTQAATGTDPGSVARTKIDCRRPTGSALVRFELRS